MATEFGRERSNPVPDLALCVEVEEIVRKATHEGESPISLAELKRKMHQNSLKHHQVRDIVDFLKEKNVFSESARGLEYAFMPTDSVVELEESQMYFD